ncbi:MAG: hypothetical protein ACRELF_27130, partial [Gemmataceae bacterium]
LTPDGKLNLARSVEPLIVASKIAIELKGKDKVWLPNRSNKVGISNFVNAVRVNGAKDRKWLIVQATDDLRFADKNNRETAETVAYYKRLHDLTPADGTAPATDEVRRFIWWLKKRNIAKFNGQGIAPETQAKRDVAEATESDIESDVAAMMRGRDEACAFELFTVSEVRESLPRLTDVRDGALREIDSKVAQALISNGARRLPQGQADLPGGRRFPRVWCASKELVAKYKDLSPKELHAAYVAMREGSIIGDAQRGDFDEEGDDATVH